MKKSNQCISIIAVIAVVSLFWIYVTILVVQPLPTNSINTNSLTSGNQLRSVVHDRHNVHDSQAHSISRQHSLRSDRYAVIIRSHAGYIKQLMTLLWALEGQTADGGIYVIIAPTEFSSIEPIKSALQLHWPDDSQLSVHVLSMDSNQYDEHCCLLDSICTSDWKRGKLLRNWSTESLTTYCTTNSPLHYFITDSALDKVRSECPFCGYLLVTNADNYYSPDFLKKSSNLMNVARVDIVVADMLHRGHQIEARVESGFMDLGGVLCKLSIFFGSPKLSFSSLLPENAEPQDWHDADFWMVYNLQNKFGRRVEFLRETLFVHN
jgi:hypothetical protein